MLINEASLKEKKLDDLKSMAKDLGLKSFSSYRKSELIQAILENVDSEENIGKELEEEKTDSKEANKHTKEDKQKPRNQDKDERIFASGLLEMHPDG